MYLAEVFPKHCMRLDNPNIMRRWQQQAGSKALGQSVCIEGNLYITCKADLMINAMLDEMDRAHYGAEASPLDMVPTTYGIQLI